MGRVAAGVLTALALAVAAGAAAAPVTAAEFPTGWDGTNPFRCELQQAGLTATVPDPEADPYCVEFDKREQNLTELGLVEFLLLEPARVAAALPVCFYFQSDHWRGSIVQDDGSTKTYEFDGHYFIDRARAEGGVWVTNFNINGRTADPSAFPGIPQEFSRHMGPGTAGFTTRNGIELDPGCVERVRDATRPVYATSTPPGAPLAGPVPVDRCPAVRGSVSARHLGPLRIGVPEERVRAALGAPVRVHRGVLRYCADGGGVLLVGQLGDRSGELGSDPSAPAALLLTTSRGVAVRGVRAGSSTRAARRAFPRAHRRLRVGRTTVVETRRGSGVLLGLRDGRVRFVGVRDRGLVRTTATLRTFLRRAL